MTNEEFIIFLYSYPVIMLSFQVTSEHPRFITAGLNNTLAPKVNTIQSTALFYPWRNPCFCSNKTHYYVFKIKVNALSYDVITCYLIIVWLSLFQLLWRIPTYCCCVILGGSFSGPLFVVTGHGPIAQGRACGTNPILTLYYLSSPTSQQPNNPVLPYPSRSCGSTPNPYILYITSHYQRHTSLTTTQQPCLTLP